MHKPINCVKFHLELGHEATIRSEVTPQGFTHDWHVFVRGADNADIHHFVEKVVFHLHESFPKPKRVVKEPPYEVRESGYASFTFPIEVYLKTKDEPRKLEFLYDLTLNTGGPSHNLMKERRVFNNPSEEFRRKLIKGGGVGVGTDMLPLTDNNCQNADDKSSSKKSSSDSSKKHKSKESLKPEEIRTNNQFADLFGTPIKTAKLSPTPAPKKSIDSKHSSDTKISSKSTSKHSPHKEKEKDKEATKKDPMISSSKEKDRDKSREKEKKSEKSLKRPPSPAIAPPPTKTMKEEPKKPVYEEPKEKEKIKSSTNEVKVEKKEKKKDKKSRDEKDKKDRHKDHEVKKETPPIPPPIEKEKIPEKPEKIKHEFKEVKENVKRSPKPTLKEDKIKDKIEKEKLESVEKQRHKHKKKEKSKKEEKELKEKEKYVKKDKVDKLPLAPPVPKEPSPPPQPLPVKSRVRSPSPKVNTNPLTKLMSELPSSDKGSDSESSGDEDSRSVEKVRRSPSPPPPAPPSPPTPTPERVKEEKFAKEKVKKKEKKSTSKDEDGSRKKKRKTKDKEDGIPEKISKMKIEEESKLIRDEHVVDDGEDRLSEPSLTGSPHRDEKEVSRSRSRSRSPTPPPKFTDEYVMELKDLQQKIMTLEDNAELQRVVQVIAETGQYEITKKTFDFDLCALDKSTVKRLQDLFFVAS